MMSEKNYTAWVMMNSENDVITEEHETSTAAVTEMIERGYTRKEMHENGFTLNKLLCNSGCWIECLEEIDY